MIIIVTFSFVSAPNRTEWYLRVQNISVCVLSGLEIAYYLISCEILRLQKEQNKIVKKPKKKRRERSNK